MKKAAKTATRRRPHRREIRKRSKAWPVISLVAIAGVAMMGYGYLQTVVEPGQSIVDHVKSMINTDSADSDTVVQPAVVHDILADYGDEDPIPEIVEVDGSMAAQLSKRAPDATVIELGTATLAVEARYIVDATEALILTANRTVDSDPLFDDWDILSALDEAGESSDSPGAQELAELDRFDQFDVVLSTTEDAGLVYDYDVSPDALLSVKRTIVDGYRFISTWSIGDTRVVQLGRPGGERPIRLHLFFLSGELRTLELVDNAQESTYWLVSRVLDPNPITASDVRGTMAIEEPMALPDEARE